MNHTHHRKLRPSTLASCTNYSLFHCLTTLAVDTWFLILQILFFILYVRECSLLYTKIKRRWNLCISIIILTMYSTLSYCPLLLGSFKQNNIRTEFCTKQTAQTSAYEKDWPQGSYCILKKGSCPTGMVWTWKVVRCVYTTMMLSLNLRMPLRTNVFYATRLLGLNLRMPLRTKCVLCY